MADTDVRVKFPYGKRYNRSWEISGSPTGMSPTHHNGIDFIRGREDTIGSKVISSSVGSVVRAFNNRCAGGIVIVKTPFLEKRRGENRRRTVYVSYAHLGKINVRRGQKLKHGDSIGTIGPPGRPCVGPTAHLHFALSHSYPRTGDLPLNPNLYWLKGVGVFSCYEASSNIPTDRLVLTSPLPCQPDKKRESKMTSKRPVYDGPIFMLSEVLRNADADTIKAWQAYFKEFGHYRGSIDGVYGRNTEIAIQKCGMDSKCVKR
jgi:hypothetical protein